MNSINSDKLREMNYKVTYDINNLKEMLGQSLSLQRPNITGSNQKNASFAIRLLQNVVGKQSGGKKFQESGINDNFHIGNAFDSESLNTMGMLDRPKRNQEDTSLYNELLQKIMEYFGVDEEKARDYRSFFKLQLEKDRPELRKNDTEKIKILADQLKTKKSAQEAFARINQAEWKAYKEEKKTQGEARRKEYEEKRRSELPVPEKKTKSSSSKIAEPKPRKPRAKKEEVTGGESPRSPRTITSSLSESPKHVIKKKSKQEPSESPKEKKETKKEKSKKPTRKQQESESETESENQSRYGYLQSEDLVLSTDRD